MDLIGKYPDKSLHTASRLIDKEAVVIIPKDNEVKVLNEVGSRIWELLDGSRNIRQIATVISDEFEVGYDKTLSDIVKFVDELCRKKMAILSENAKEGIE